MSPFGAGRRERTIALAMAMLYDGATWDCDFCKVNNDKSLRAQRGCPLLPGASKACFRNDIGMGVWECSVCPGWFRTTAFVKSVISIGSCVSGETPVSWLLPGEPFASVATAIADYCRILDGIRTRNSMESGNVG